MSCMGVLFAIEPSVTRKLLGMDDDQELIGFIQEEIETNWEEEWTCETEKSWDAIHRCFASGGLDLLGGNDPLSSVIFGGNILTDGRDYHVSLKSNKLVKNIADHIGEISQDKMRDLYVHILDDYQGQKSEEDFGYTWEWFRGLQLFYLKVARTDKDVIFTVDQ